jgi:cell division protein FtsL
MTSARVAAEARRSAAIHAPEEARRESFRSRLRLVDRTAPEHRRIGWFTAVAVVVVLLFAIAGAQTLIISEQAHIDRVNNRISEAETRAELLRVELAKLQSPQNITTAATTRLGMIPAPTPVYLQPKPTDDARAAEMPPPPTPTTIARSTATTTQKTTPTTAAKSSPSTTTAATAGTR